MMILKGPMEASRGSDALPVLPYSRQWLDDDDLDAVLRVLRGDWLTQGPAVGAFEKALAETCGARHAVAVSSGTAALHLACLAAGVGPGDVGVTSPITFVASANCIAYCGGTPCFADIDPNTDHPRPRSTGRGVRPAEAEGDYPGRFRRSAGRPAGDPGGRPAPRGAGDRGRGPLAGGELRA